MNRLEFLTQSEIEEIHNIALDNLQKFGSWMNEDKVLELLARRGCKVDKNTKIRNLKKKMFMN